MAKHMDVYAAYVNSDLTEGKGYLVLVGHFTRGFDAEAAVRGKGVMGGNGTVKLEHICVFETYDEYLAEQEDAVRKRALAKLTPEERRALCLTE